jgi:hypothetical protein
MKTRLALVTILCLVTTGASLADSASQHMLARAQESEARNGNYATVATKTFWGDVSFMPECVPNGNPLREAFTIYFEVLANGKLGEVVFEPDTKIAECIRRHVTNRTFPLPPGGSYVTKINMRFAE